MVESRETCILVSQTCVDSTKCPRVPQVTAMPVKVVIKVWPTMTGRKAALHTNVLGKRKYNLDYLWDDCHQKTGSSHICAYEVRDTTITPE